MKRKIAAAVLVAVAASGLTVAASSSASAVNGVAPAPSIVNGVCTEPAPYGRSDAGRPLRPARVYPYAAEDSAAGRLTGREATR